MDAFVILKKLNSKLLLVAVLVVIGFIPALSNSGIKIIRSDKHELDLLYTPVFKDYKIVNNNPF